MQRSIFFIFFIFYCAGTSFLVGGCDRNDSFDPNAKLKGQKPADELPLDKKKSHICHAQNKESCNGRQITESGWYYCAWINDLCIEATECSQISSLLDCESGIPGKLCGKRGQKCVELVNCKGLSKEACQGKAAQGGANSFCSWSYQKHLCETVEEAYVKRSSAAHITAGGGTVCAQINIPADTVCWGDDSGKKYSEGFLPDSKLTKIVLGDDFACAEILSAISLTESRVKCWGANAQINNAPTDLIVRDSLSINNNVACVELEGIAAKAKKIKCWGNFAGTMENTKLDPIKIGPQGTLYLNQAIVGNVPLESQQMSVGSDFLCVKANNLGSAAANPPPMLVCSGKANFAPSFRGPKLGISPSFTNLVTANNFGCFINRDPTGPNEDKAYCFKQPGDGTTFSDTFLFGGSEFSPKTFHWIKAGPDYICGMKYTDTYPTCYSNNPNSPALSVPPIPFEQHPSKFALGADFICGITLPSHKVHCWGSNASIVNNIPESLKH